MPEKKKDKDKDKDKSSDSDKTGKTYKKTVYECKSSSFTVSWAKRHIGKEKKPRKDKTCCQAFVLFIVSIIFMGFSWKKVD